MKLELEKKLWNAFFEGIKNYEEEEWIIIINAFLEDFKETINQEFIISSAPNIYYNNQGLNLWICSQKQPGYPLRNLWKAVIGGGRTPIYNKEGDIEERFSISLTMFVFDQKSKKRVGLVTGESVIEFGFQYQDNAPAKWINFGWHKDAFREWEYVKWE